MKINKITSGYVIQTFDTRLKKFIEQRFVTGDPCEYEDEDGNIVESTLLEVDGDELYLPYDMIQPK